MNYDSLTEIIEAWQSHSGQFSVSHSARDLVPVLDEFFDDENIKGGDAIAAADFDECESEVLALLRKRLIPLNGAPHSIISLADADEILDDIEAVFEL